MTLETILEAIRHAVDLRLAEVDALPQGIQNWMVFMRSLFLSSIFFAIWRTEARVVLAMAIGTAMLLFGFKALFPETHSGEIGRIIHVTLWAAVLLFLLTRVRSLLSGFRSSSIWPKIYGAWALVVIIVLGISLAFDVTAIIAAVASS
jgi:hypothetical protein